MTSTSKYIYIGITSGLLSIWSFLKHYTLSGDGLISSSNAKHLIKNGAVVIDVRSMIEWDIGHHKSAVHIPLSKLSDKMLLSKGIKKSDKIVVYCNTGQRARRASDIIRNLGYKNVFYIEGSYLSIQ